MGFIRSKVIEFLYFWIIKGSVSNGLTRHRKTLCMVTYIDARRNPQKRKNCNNYLNLLTGTAMLFCQYIKFIWNLHHQNKPCFPEGEINSTLFWINNEKELHLWKENQCFMEVACSPTWIIKIRQWLFFGYIYLTVFCRKGTLIAI